MRRILGYVLVRETNEGIPNLVVSAFDGGLAADGIREQAPLAEVVQKLGRRIASVLTDRAGRFALPAEDLDFTGNEPRPDLVLGVFAPEDVTNPHFPYPAPPDRRTLYLSIVPRVDAGAEEAFVIRILQSEADRIHMDPHAERLADAQETAWRFNDTLMKRTSARNANERSKAETRRAKAIAKTKDLSAVPPNLRGHELLVIGKTALEKQREPLQYKVVNDALDRMATPRYSQRMRLYLSEQELKDLKLTDENGQMAKEVDSAAVLQAVRARLGVDLVRVRGMNNPSPDELEARYLRPDARPVVEPEAGPVVADAGPVVGPDAGPVVE